MTNEEIILWKHLRNNALGFKFRRQHSIGPYILDFYCPKANLIIEIDGSQHLNAKDYDSERDLMLSSRGYKVIRFSNEDITRGLTNVLTKIGFELGNYST